MTEVTAITQVPSREALIASYLRPIAAWFGVAGVSEIMVNNHRSVFVEREGITSPADALAAELGIDTGHWRNEGHLLATIEAIANALGQPVSAEEPILDARLVGYSNVDGAVLPNGARINATVPPIACDGCTLNIRLFPRQRYTWEDLRERGTFDLIPDAPARLQALLRAGKTGLVTGAIRSGKTTLLGVLIGEIEQHRRLVTVEDTRELQVLGANVVRGECAQRKGRRPIAMHDLLVNAMRQSPHTIVVGEIRHGQAAGVALEAMQLGHPVLTTMHARDAKGAIQRFVKLALRNDSQIPYAELRQELLTALDFVVHMQQLPDGSRKVTELLDVASLRGAVRV